MNLPTRKTPNSAQKLQPITFGVRRFDLGVRRLDGAVVGRDLARPSLREFTIECRGQGRRKRKRRRAGALQMARNRKPWSCVYLTGESRA
jgi:hypothetical protein